MTKAEAIDVPTMYFLEAIECRWRTPLVLRPRNLQTWLNPPRRRTGDRRGLRLRAVRCGREAFGTTREAAAYTDHYLPDAASGVSCTHWHHGHAGRELWSRKRSSGLSPVDLAR